MKRAGELIVFSGLAIVIHVALFAEAPDNGVQAGGSGGEALVSIEGANATVAEMVETWHRPRNRQPVTEPVLDPVETEVNAPDLPRLDLAEAPRADLRMAAMPPVETETLPLRTEPALPRPRVTPPEITRPKAPATPETTPPLRNQMTRPDIATPHSAPMAQPQSDTLDIETEAAEPPTSDVAPTVSRRPPQRPEREPPTRTARKAQQSAPAQARQRAAGSGGGSQAGKSGSAKSATLSKGQQAKLQAVWGAKIRARIERAKRYPRGTNASGQTTLAITISRTGQLQAVSVRRSSGNGRLDQASLDAVRRAGRFPAAPKDLPGDTFRFGLAVVLKR